MSEERRPRRSAAASNKAWATLMPKGGEEEFADEAAAHDVPKVGMKRSASKEQAPTPSGRGRKKKQKLESESEAVSDHNTSHEQQLNTSASDIKPDVFKPLPRSPRKLLPKITKVTPAALPQGNDNVEMMHQAFDQHQADLAEKLEGGDMGGEEEEMVPAELKTAKIPAKARGRPSKNAQQAPPPALTGMDDPNDEDYDPMGSPEEARPAPKKRASQSRPRPAVAAHPPMSPPQMRQPVYRPPPPPVRATTLVVRQPIPATRVVYPARFPTIVNGGPRVVQPRYISQNNAPRNLNPAALRQPVNNNAYDTPVNVLREIEKLTEDCKKVSSPEVVSAFQLVEILREEMERMQQHIRESNHYYRSFIEDLQAAAHSQFESSQNRCISLEQRVTSLEAQLKKCSAVAHQKLLKTAVEGFRTNVSEQPTQPMSSQKVSHQYVMMEGEPSGIEQHMQPQNYLVQEEDYQVPHPGGFYQESMIQEAAKDVDNEL